MKRCRVWPLAIVLFGTIASLLLAGCSGHDAVRCESTDRYTAVRSVGPVRIPDDLTPPDESDALQLPPASAADGAAPPAGGCLEEPPKFSRNSNGATPPATPAPTPPPPSPDREISN